MKSKVIAIFDFDGTLTIGDTFIPFLFHSFGPRKTVFGLFYCMPFIIVYIIKLVSNEYAKSKVINFFFKDKNMSTIKKNANSFINNESKFPLRENVVNRLKWHQEQKHITILISASLDIYVKSWAKKFEFTYVESTELQCSNGNYTGLISGKNCYGKEKVKRLKKILKDDLNNYLIYGYGDSKGDKYFLELCDYKFLKNDLSKLK